jgi:hypothetical protein
LKYSSFPPESRTTKRGVSPIPVLQFHVVAFKLGTELINRLTDTERDEHEALANLVRPLTRENKRATLTVGLRDKRFAVFLEAPTLREPQSIHIEVERAIDVGDEQDGASMPSSRHRCSS